MRLTAQMAATKNILAFIVAMRFLPCLKQKALESYVKVDKVHCRRQFTLYDAPPCEHICPLFLPPFCHPAFAL